MAVAVALVLAVAVLSLRLWLSIVYEGRGTRKAPRRTREEETGRDKTIKARGEMLR